MSDNPNPNLSVESLTALLGGWPDGCIGTENERRLFSTLTRLSTVNGYGRVKQVTEQIVLLMYDQDKNENNLLQEFVNSRVFLHRAMGWELPASLVRYVNESKHNLVIPPEA